jgi:hypothetical protein
MSLRLVDNASGTVSQVLKPTPEKSVRHDLHQIGCFKKSAFIKFLHHGKPKSYMLRLLHARNEGDPDS